MKKMKEPPLATADEAVHSSCSQREQHEQTATRRRDKRQVAMQSRGDAGSELE